MANYCAISITNLFKVLDEEKYREWCSRLLSECGIEETTKASEKDGSLLHMLSSYSSVSFEYDDQDGYHDLLEELQELLPKDEAFIYTEVGNEKMDLVAVSIIVTRNDIRVVNLDDVAVETAREMLGNPDKEFY